MFNSAGLDPPYCAKTNNEKKALAIMGELFIVQQNKWLAQADEYLKEAREIRAETKGE
jgi:hypothetical protein